MSTPAMPLAGHDDLRSSSAIWQLGCRHFGRAKGVARLHWCPADILQQLIDVPRNFRRGGTIKNGLTSAALP